MHHSRTAGHGLEGGDDLVDAVGGGRVGRGPLALRVDEQLDTG